MSTPEPIDADGDDWYLSREELQKVVGGVLTTNLPRYRRAIAGATDQINELTGRRFTRDSVATARTFRASSCWEVCVGDFSDPSEVTVETWDRAAGDWAPWSADDWSPGVDDEGLGRGARRTGHPWRWILSNGTRKFPVSRQFLWVRVTTKWGWAAIPGAISLACQELATAHYQSLDRGEQMIDGDPLMKAEKLLTDYAVDGGTLYCQPLAG